MRRRDSGTSIVVWSTICIFITSFSFTSYSLFLPAMLDEFAWSRADLALPFSLSMAVWGITQPVIGALADRRGTRVTILGGIVGMAVGFMVMGTAQQLWQVAVGYGVIVGTATSGAGNVTYSLLVSKWFSGASRASANGIVQAATPASPIILAPILFIGITAFGWRLATVGYALALLVAALPLAYIFLREPKAAPGDAPASVSGSRKKIILSVVRVPALRNLFVSRFACGLSLMITAHLAAAAVSSGLTLAEGAAAVSVYGVSGALGTFAGGLAADRWGRVPTLVATYLFRGLGCLVLALVSANAPLFYLGVALAAGPIMATFTINNVQVFELVGAKQAGFILGVSIVLHQIAAALTTYLGGVAFDLTGSYRLAFLVLAVLLWLVGAIPSAYTGPAKSTVRPRPAAEPAGR